MSETPKKQPLYTRFGDKGHTLAVGGKWVRKSDSLIEASGELDELICALGLAATEPGLNGEIRDILIDVQRSLFTVGASIASVHVNRAKTDGISDADIADIESKIDSFDAKLQPMNSFVIPGGRRTAAFLHAARAICRRAERRVVELSDETGRIPNVVLAYINRLSDLLFVLARTEQEKND